MARKERRSNVLFVDACQTSTEAPGMAFPVFPLDNMWATFGNSVNFEVYVSRGEQDIKIRTRLTKVSILIVRTEIYRKAKTYIHTQLYSKCIIQLRDFKQIRQYT